jgi:PTH1 family peptidyl-tRNA hydrolase
MKLVVGLGNPGFQYEKNRHNVGFQCLDFFAVQHNIRFEKKSMHAIWTKTSIGVQEVVLAKPQTYMNLSGTSVLQLANFYKINPREDLLAISDDLDLPTGKIRLRTNGSSGGQNGLKNIFEVFGTQEIQRMRIGIGRPHYGKPHDYVLNDFSAEQVPIITDALKKASEAIETWLAQGIAKAMNIYNIQ